MVAVSGVEIIPLERGVCVNRLRIPLKRFKLGPRGLRITLHGYCGRRSAILESHSDLEWLSSYNMLKIYLSSLLPSQLVDI